jgi:hypothetical protein
VTAAGRGGALKTDARGQIGPGIVVGGVAAPPARAARATAAAGTGLGMAARL